MRKILLATVAVLFTVHMYAQTTPCVDAGGGCTNTENPDNQSTFDTSYGYGSLNFDPTASVNASSDSTTNPYVDYFTPESNGTLIAEGGGIAFASFTGAAVVQAIGANAGFAGVGQFTVQGPLVLDAEVFNSVNIGPLGNLDSGTNFMFNYKIVDFGNSPINPGTVMDAADKGGFNAGGETIDLDPGGSGTGGGNLGGGGPGAGFATTGAALAVQALSVAAMVVTNATTMGNASNSGNMNYSSVGSHMQPESETVPSSIYGNSNPMNNFTPTVPPSLLSGH